MLRMLGQGRLEAQCMDGVKRLCHIRGKMRKKVWVNVGDIVLLGLREYQVRRPVKARLCWGCAPRPPRVPGAPPRHTLTPKGFDTKNSAIVGP